jgi:hypothetical protein
VGGDGTWETNKRVLNASVKPELGFLSFFVYFAGQHDEPLLKEARADHTQKVLFRHCRSCINSSIFLFVFLFCRRGGGRCSRGIGVGLLEAWLGARGSMAMMRMAPDVPTTLLPAIISIHPSMHLCASFPFLFYFFFAFSFPFSHR